MVSMKPKRIGGADTYTIKSSTLVEGYFPGAGRQNFLQDPTYRLGKVDFSGFACDQNYNGPGTLVQSLPDASRLQYRQIFAKPQPTINKEVAIDNRQLASYQVEQLHANPLSQYTTDPDAPIPTFFVDSNPKSYSSMIATSERELKEWLANMPKNNYAPPAVPAVYEQHSGRPENVNAEVVYNMSLNSTEEFNPFISQGSSRHVPTVVDVRNKGYSGYLNVGDHIATNSGSDPPRIYGPDKLYPRTQSDIGMMNTHAGNMLCAPNKSLKFANPLVLNTYR